MVPGRLGRMRLPPPITSRTNARVKALRAAFGGRAARPGEMTALEGEHLLAEAARAGLPVQTLYVREGSQALLEAPWAGALQAETVLLSREVFDSVVDTATPQGIAGMVAIPSVSRSGLENAGAVLLLENVQDPGNVGTLIRSAAAFGALEVLLVGECANPWSPKVLRSSAGAVFQMPVQRLDLREALASVRGQRCVYAAVVSGDGAVASTEANLERAVLMIGSEGRGLSPEALALADQRVTIPCRIESLNAAVAGSILLYECFRQAQAGKA